MKLIRELGKVFGSVKLQSEKDVADSRCQPGPSTEKILVRIPRRLITVNSDVADSRCQPGPSTEKILVRIPRRLITVNFVAH
ncbi:hypothetical protein TNIN_239861 [Trichonephila inaurata madagascariensis]|uniref:Uncharacterized protein n=1 Tax=Trichonephila inaurata madagascariensis TaxID=2747483 RepID=A0A8X7CEI4_9ARAC|nr:hypothetical protein TNIN_239861 [Trichonephila inaurata madagascariensis]